MGKYEFKSRLLGKRCDRARKRFGRIPAGQKQASARLIDRSLQLRMVHAHRRFAA